MQALVKHYYKRIARVNNNFKKVVNRLNFDRDKFEYFNTDLLQELVFNSHKFVTYNMQYTHTIAMGYNKDTKTVYIAWSKINKVDIKKRVNVKTIGHDMTLKRLATMYKATEIITSKNLPFCIFQDGLDFMNAKGSKYFKDDIDKAAFYIDKDTVFTINIPNNNN